MWFVRAFATVCIETLATGKPRDRGPSLLSSSRGSSVAYVLPRALSCKGAPVVCLAIATGCDAQLDPVGALPPAPTEIWIEAEAYTSVDLREGAANFALVNAGVEDERADPDAPHLEGASGEAYVEALPDTFTADGEAEANVSFFRQPGTGCTLTYRLLFPDAGTHFVWLRAFGGGAKDNTVFFGLDGRWQPTPAQVCGGARWRWTNALRDEPNGGICSATARAEVEVAAPGEHNFQLSVREDGFELDQLLLSRDPNFLP